MRFEGTTAASTIPGVAVGDPFVADLLYEEQSACPHTQCAYEYLAFSLTFQGGLLIETTPESGGGRLFVQNVVPANAASSNPDMFRLEGVGPLQGHAIFGFEDPTGLTLETAALPAIEVIHAGLSSGRWNTRNVETVGLGGTDANGLITNVIPEPGTGLLLGLGLITLAASGGRSARRGLLCLAIASQKRVGNCSKRTRQIRVTWVGLLGRRWRN